MVGDHLALDLLNTEARIGGEPVDYWRDGEDVLRWLAGHPDVYAPIGGDAVAPARLLEEARALRAEARALVERFRQGAAVDPGVLNAYLHAYRTAPHLERDVAGRLVLTRVPQCDPVASALGPVAEAVARLLTEGDPALVRQCDHPECVLWFYDRTKARRRRWCSMALCGNRHKAARFRAKRGSHADSGQPLRAAG